MKQLHISKDLSLPLDAATQTFAFIARKGAGKTYAAGKLAECLMDAQVQVVILDSVGNWWGLRLAADGKTPAYDIPVIGGLRGDIPLEATAGHLIADIVIDTGRSLIVDVSQFSKAHRQKFAYEFAERLWRAKKAERHPVPLHLIIEESQLIVPQFIGKGNTDGTALMVGIYEEIIRLGRNYGIGVTMISQRPQSVNKEVLNQTECLVALQVNGAQERKALELWITHQGLEKQLVDELPALPIGTAYVWSPQWLQILQKVRIGEKKTFDASATPKVGGHQVRRDLKPLNLDDLKDRMAATIEKAKAEDPKELRRINSELRAQIRKLESAKPQAAVETKVEVKMVEKRIMAVQSINRLEQLLDKASAIPLVVEGIRAAIREGKELNTANVATAPVAKPSRAVGPAGSAYAKYVKPAPKEIAANGNLTKPEQRVLDALAWWEAIGVSQPDKGQVGFIAGYRVGKNVGGAYGNLLGGLRSRGYLEYPSAGAAALTAEGRSLARYLDIHPSLDALHEAIFNRLANPEVRVLRGIVEVYPERLTKQEAGAQAGYTVGNNVGGTFGNILGKLRSLGLIDYPAPGFVVATELLFPPGLS